MLDLYNKEYSRETLKKYIYSVRLIDILKTQKLDVTFIVRYILNTKYQLCDIDEYINIDTVLMYQKHINKQKLLDALVEYTSDDDSIDDFETVSKKIETFLDLLRFLYFEVACFVVKIMLFKS